MQVEDTPTSRRLLLEHKVDSGRRGGDFHDNAAFSSDDSVFVDLFDGQTVDSLTSREISFDSHRKRGSTGSTSSATRKGYNRLDDENESPDDMDSNLDILPPDWSKQEALKDQTTRHQVKETFNPPPLNQQTPQKPLLEGSNQNSVIHTSHENMAQPRVGFKLGHRHSQKTDISELKEGKFPSLLSNMAKNMEPIQIAKTSQRQTSLPPAKHASQGAKEKKVSFEQDDVIEEAMDATLFFHSTGPPQRNWTAYKSAMHFQPRSVDTTTGGQQILHPSLTARSQSMRLHRQRPVYGLPKIQPKKLLSQLSFSDSGAETIHDYGSLGGGQSLPRKTLKSNTGGIERKDDSKLPPSAIAILIGLMEELLDRGKIREVALLSLAGGAPVASVPVSWNLSSTVATSVVKAVLETGLPLVRVMINEEKYVCLKHGPNRMVGHSENNDVLVAQKTAHYIVIGLSEEDTPGSCLQEVLELVEILTEKGW